MSQNTSSNVKHGVSLTVPHSCSKDANASKGPGNRDWGTTAVLLADMIAALAVVTWGILYIKTDLRYLVLLFSITLGLALLVGLLLRQGSQRPPTMS